MAKKFALAFDLQLCTGCETCTIACRLENGTGGWITVQTVQGELAEAGEVRYHKLSWQPVTCMHCDNPPCREACPEGAIVKREDGIVLVEEENCVNCLVCVDACPYQAIYADPRLDVVGKCNLCLPRIEQGLEPFCVRECTGRAIRFGDVNDPQSELSKLLASREAKVLQPEKGTMPSVYYLVGGLLKGRLL